MADIIRLADRQTETTRRTPKEVEPAQILLFTGVRYERLEPKSKRPSPSAKRSKSRVTKRG